MGISENRLISVIAVTAAVIVSGLSGVSAAYAKTDDCGHVLVREWKDYYEAVEKDLPQTRADVLEKIIGKAEKRRLSWDFYDAVRKYRDAVRSFDWKRYNAETDTLRARIAEYGDPVVIWNFSDVYPRLAEVPDMEDIAAMTFLKSRRSDSFYKDDRFFREGLLPEAIAGNISCDYEYLLWSALMRWYIYSPVRPESGGQDNFDIACNALAEYYSGHYPEAAYLEFLEVMRFPSDSTDRKKAGLEDFAEKYGDKAVSLYARQELIGMEFSALEESEASQEEYIALRSRCADFEKDRRGMWEEASLVGSCTYPSELMKRLDSSMIRAEVKEDSDTLLIALRNLPDVEIRILDEDSTSVYSRHMRNEARSYYVPDTLKLVLPSEDDGTYRIVCRSGDTEASFRYDRYTLSMAWQMQDKGLAVYLADFRSGKPVPDADVSVFYRDSLVRVIRDVHFNGFTLIDTGIPEDAGYVRIQCSGTYDGILRRTEKCSVRMYGSGSGSDRSGTFSAVLLTDRAAFNPGDTLKYKAVLYEMFQDRSSGMPGTSYKVWTGKEQVVAELADASGRVVAADTLTVNDFGSAAGSFRIPEDRMNGRYVLSITVSGRVLASRAVTVDEFVLPTFDVTFEPSGRIWFPEDTVTVNGKITGYAGQSLAAAAVTYRVSLWNEVMCEGRLEPEPDGSFSVDFAAGDGKSGTGSQYYRVEVNVTDATGETHEFSDMVIIGGFYFNVDVENMADASITRSFLQERDTPAGSAGVYGICAPEGDFAVLTFSLKNAGYDPVPGKTVRYDIYCRDSLMKSGQAVSGEKVWIDMSSWPSSTYRVTASVEVGDRTGTCVCDIVKTSETDESMDVPYENFFKVLPSDDIRFQFGAAAGPVWAAVQIFGADGACLSSEIVHLPGVCGKKGSLRTISYDFKDEYPDNVLMKVIYFRNGTAYRFDHEFTRRNSGLMLPLSFIRFVDKAYPGVACHYRIRTLPGVECAVSVFDVTTETVRANIWSRVMPYRISPYVHGAFSDGTISGRGWSALFPAGDRDGSGDTAIPFQLKSASPRSSTAGAVADAVMENSAMTESYAGEVMIRDNFTESLAFYPFLRSDKDGMISFGFTAGDKLSTYCVSLFAHDRSMNNNILRDEMMVTLPVTVSVVPPLYLYSGDRYDLQVALSNVSDSESEGILSVYLYEGSDYEMSSPLSVSSRPARIGSGSAVSEPFSIEVPENTDTLGIKVVYAATDGVSDGLFVTIPVSAPVQTLYESHSALLLPDMSKDSLFNALRGQFVNVSGYGAVPTEISIAGMLEEAIPEKIRPSSPDAISVAGAYLASLLTRRLGNETGECPDCNALAEELLSYQNAGGGFAWLRGGRTSPIVTAAVLEYISVMERKSLIGHDSQLVRAAEKAVRYLDRYYFSQDRLPFWAGDLNLQQYLFIRSLYDTVPLSVSLDRKVLKAFSKQVRNYLYAKDADPSGYILSKARRAATVLNFVVGRSNENSFSRSVRLNTGRRLASSLDRYMASLKEYAVGHRSGGTYFPNAVMPFRGLLESELYAHSVLCRLMSDYGARSGDNGAFRIADGIRLWIMVQKETQSWDDEPAYLLALDSVMDGSPELLSSKVLVLTMKYMKPFGEIKAAGNGISVKCRYFVEDASASGRDAEFEGYRELTEGEILETGQKVLAVYYVWSAENRSFVRLEAPRHASLRPADQLSGYYGVHVRPRAGAPSAGYFTPYSYREVKSDRSIWYIDVLAEENTMLAEMLVVSQSGIFSSAVSDACCMYASHYRANASCPPRLSSESGK